MTEEYENTVGEKLDLPDLLPSTKKNSYSVSVQPPEKPSFPQVPLTATMAASKSKSTAEALAEARKLAASGRRKRSKPAEQQPSAKRAKGDSSSSQDPTALTSPIRTSTHTIVLDEDEPAPHKDKSVLPPKSSKTSACLQPRKETVAESGSGFPLSSFKSRGRELTDSGSSIPPSSGPSPCMLTIFLFSSYFCSLFDLPLILFFIPVASLGLQLGRELLDPKRVSKAEYTLPSGYVVKANEKIAGSKSPIALNLVHSLLVAPEVDHFAQMSLDDSMRAQAFYLSKVITIFILRSLLFVFP